MSWNVIIAVALLLVAISCLYVLVGWRKAPLAQKRMYVLVASGFASGLLVGIWSFHLYSGRQPEPEHTASSPPSAVPSTGPGGQESPPNPKILTRDWAAQTIARCVSSKLGTSVHLSVTALVGMNEGLWTAPKDPSNPIYDLTERGQTLLGGPVRDNPGHGLSWITSLKAPAQYRVTVTGITEEPLSGNATKDIKFTWLLDGIPSPVTRYVSPNGSGGAKATLYDDGWRIEEIEVGEQDSADEIINGCSG